MVVEQRIITFMEALAEATVQAMEMDPRVLVFGEGAADHTGVYGSTLPARKQFPDRVQEMPLAEDAMTGICAGLALRGWRPMVVHQRIEFMMLAINQLVNHASKWRALFNNNAGSMPFVTRAVIGRGNGQSAQHAQNLQTLVAHIPGLIVVTPATPYAAKGLLLAALQADDPVVFIDHRWCHALREAVPSEPYCLPLDQARVVREGVDVTIVTASYMLTEAMVAARSCETQGLSVEVIDLQTINPIDWETVRQSVTKTGRLVVADLSWYAFGLTATVAGWAAEHCFSALRVPVRTVSLPPMPVPTSAPLETAYYPGAQEIADAVCATCMCASAVVDTSVVYEFTDTF